MRIAILFLLAAATIAAAQTQDNPPPRPPDGGGQQRGERRGPGIGGAITAISGDSLTIKTFDGRTVMVKLTDTTRYRKDQQDAKLSDFKVGDMVMVRGEKSGDDSVVAAAVMSRSGMAARMTPDQMREKMGKEIVAGEIKSIDGLKLTIARMDGETQTITVDENTSFRKQGESVTLADLKPGDRVFARGQLKDGMFVPSVLNVGPPPGMRGSGRPEGAPPEQH